MRAEENRIDEKDGGLGLLVIGLFLVIVGWLVQSSIFEWLLDIIGLVIIVGGIIVGVTGLVKLVTGRGGSSDF